VVYLAGFVFLNQCLNVLLIKIALRASLIIQQKPPDEPLPLLIEPQPFIKVYMGFACIAIALFLIGIKLINPYIVGGVILCGFAILVFKVFLTKEDRALFGSLAHSLVNRRGNVSDFL